MTVYSRFKRVPINCPESTVLRTGRIFLCSFQSVCLNSSLKIQNKSLPILALPRCEGNTWSFINILKPESSQFITICPGHYVSNMSGSVNTKLSYGSRPVIFGHAILSEFTNRCLYTASCEIWTKWPWGRYYFNISFISYDFRLQMISFYISDSRKTKPNCGSSSEYFLKFLFQ